MKSTPTLSSLQESLRPLREKLAEHEIYQQIGTIEDLRTFMEHHIYAVWDFMSLLKTLQCRLTCVTVPWVPKGDRRSRRLINEIVLEEESDTESEGGSISHFELYRAAMEQCGADTLKIDCFLERLGNGETVGSAIERAGAPKAARAFVRTTVTILESDSLPAIAAAFTLGREDVIPIMFRPLVHSLQERLPGKLTLFLDYLDRHIRLDEERHTPMGLEMLETLCSNHPWGWEHAAKTARAALKARIALWDGVVEQMARNRAGTHNQEHGAMRPTINDETPYSKPGGAADADSAFQLLPI